MLQTVGKFLKKIISPLWIIQKVISLQSLLENELKAAHFEPVEKHFRISHQASVAQLVEQLICNQLVGGSSPSAGSS